MTLINNQFKKHLQFIKMSSDEQIVTVTKRKVNKLMLDSDEQARIEAQEKERQQQIAKRKEEKRRHREEQERQRQEEEERKKAIEAKYDNPEMMVVEDSDSGDRFSRIDEKITKAYPELKKKSNGIQQKKKRMAQSSDGSDSDSDSDGSDDDSDSQSEESQQKPKRVPKRKPIEKERKIEKRRQRNYDESSEAPRARKIKIEEDDPKTALAKQVAVRWWYCMPEWPQKGFSYEQQLNRNGYRYVDNEKFRNEEDLVNGKYKATPIEGYQGLYRTKKIIDIRPKDNCPSFSYLKSKSMQELTKMLKTCLRGQIQEIKQVKYLQSGQEELTIALEKQLLSLK